MMEDELIKIDFVQDRRDGQWWWINRSDPTARSQGPFRTQVDAEKNAKASTFGLLCEFKYGGQWDPREP